MRFKAKAMYFHHDPSHNDLFMDKIAIDANKKGLVP